MNYYVYVDWTTEDSRRPFYVGKGSGGRALRQKRNWKHRSVREMLGFDRQIVFETALEGEALQHEIALIVKYHTFIDDPLYNGVGCNFTAGGEGGAHPSARTRELIAESNRRRVGEKRSIRTRQRISNAIKASNQRNGRRILSKQHRQRISDGLIGHVVSEKTRQKLKSSTTMIHRDPIIKQKIVDGIKAANQRQDVKLRRSEAARLREQRKREEKLNGSS